WTKLRGPRVSRDARGKTRTSEGAVRDVDQEPQNVAHGAVADEANQPVDETRIAALRAEVASLVDGRPHDHIKALVALAEALPPGEEKVELFLQAADLYTNTFKNQAEAVRAYEAVLALDP